MPVWTRHVAAVDSKTIYRDPVWSPRRLPTGTRYDVLLRVPGSVFTESVYTRDALKASLCLQAKQIQQAVTVATRDTRWGSELVTVELAEPTREAV